MRTILFILITVFSLNISAQTKEQKKFNREYGKVLRKNKKQVGEFVYFKRDTIKLTHRNHEYYKRNQSRYRKLEFDSTLLLYCGFNTSPMDPFFMSKAEVTNIQYKAFVNWVRDSIARDLLVKVDSSYLNNKKKIDWSDQKTIEILKDLYEPETERFLNRKQLDKNKIKYSLKLTSAEVKSICVYPDSTVWYDEFGTHWSFNNTRWYYGMSYNEDKPVVAISFEQAQAYCQWLTNVLNRNNGGYRIEVRLPTENELQVGEGGYFYNDDNSLYSEKEGYLANWAHETNLNNYRVKSATDDGGFEPVEIKSFPKNYWGLYDVKGNVSEWTTTEVKLDQYLLLEKEIFERITLLSDKIDSLKPKPFEQQVPIGLQMKQDYIEHLKSTKERLENELIQIRSDIEIIKKCKDCRVVKGGSWAQSAIYTDAFGAKEVKEASTQSSMTGFRICISVTPEIEEYYKSKKRKR